MIVSLGSTCSVSYQLQKHEKRTVAFPFDWIRTESLADITFAIKDNFKEFLNVENVDRSDKFPTFDPEKESFPEENKGSSIIMKNKYGMKFYHDFSDSVDIDVIKEKYTRRISRFLDLIKTCEEVCFIRDEMKASKISVDQIEDFLQTIESINPLIKIKLILIIRLPKDKKLDILNYKNRSVQIISDTEPYGNWSRPNVSWSDIFNIL